MLKHRVIPCLLIRDGGLVKTIRFSDPKYIGDPINAVKIFNEKEVDELMVVDIGASRNGQPPNFRLIEEFASECFIPLCYGGGIHSLEHAQTLFSIGIEKICLQSASYVQPELINKVAERYGSQSIVLSVDVRKDWLSRKKLYHAAIGKNISLPYIQHIKECVLRGVGEVVINAVDRDGVMRGYDLDLIREVAGAVDVPVVALGGAGCLNDFRQAVYAGASAVAAGAMFVFHGPHRAVLISYPPYSELTKLFTN